MLQVFLGTARLLGLPLAVCSPQQRRCHWGATSVNASGFLKAERAVEQQRVLLVLLSFLLWSLSSRSSTSTGLYPAYIMVVASEATRKRDVLLLCASPLLVVQLCAERGCLQILLVFVVSEEAEHHFFCWSL